LFIKSFDLQIFHSQIKFKYPLKLESFYVLSLTLPQVRPATSQHDFLSAMGSVNLYECLNNYFKPELITEMKCESCCCAEADSNGDKKPLESSTSGNKKLKSKGFIKRQAIAKLPDTLCIQIQRNSWSDQANEMVKKTNHVKFPLSIKIDNVAPGVINAQRFSNAAMSSFSSSSFSLRQVGIGALLGGNKQLTSSRSAGNVSTSSPGGVASPNMIQSYELRSAIVHYGSAHSGHFVAYRKPLGSSSAATDDWLQISDSDIKKVKQSTLLNSNVYMLFYDKVANMVLASPDL
jgi:ubiquitin C-terminal hydrolase